MMKEEAGGRWGGGLCVVNHPRIWDGTLQIVLLKKGDQKPYHIPDPTHLCGNCSHRGDMLLLSRVGDGFEPSNVNHALIVERLPQRGEIPALYA